MSATLTAKGLSAAHGDRTLFAGLDLVLAPGDALGVVGPNGAGKSTLFKLLAGLAPPGSGRVSLSPPGAIVGYLPQESDPVAGETVLGLVARRTGVAPAQAALDAAADALAAGHPIGGLSAEDAYSLALERWLALGAADLEERTEATLADLGLGVDPATEVATLSRGQATRAGLASLLLSRYDVFLLDEPTNDLDLDGLERLEQFVSGLRVGVGLISHDREFLVRTATKIVELDLAQQQVKLYGGGYTAYLAERQIARRQAREAYEGYADRVGELTERARTQRAWMEKGDTRADIPESSILSTTPEQTVTELRSAPANGKDIWLFGGGELFRTLLAARLVDEIELAVIPILLTDGIPLLPATSQHIHLALEAQKSYKSGTLSLTYSIVYR